ncbi:MAG: hypothetical protein V1871_09130 [Planctomycetota bacterium]
MSKTFVLRPFGLLTIFWLLFFLISCSSSPKLTDNLKANKESIKRIGSMNLLDHTVALAPIEKELSSQKIDEKKERLIDINSNNFSDKLIEAFQANQVFKKIEKLSGDNTSKKAQIQGARDKKSSLLMNITVKKAKVYCAGANNSALGNTAMWFLLGIPSLWGADTNYGVEIIADVSFFDIASSLDFATLVYSYECLFKVEGGLSYFERSSSMAVLAMPPQFCPDNLDKVKESVLPLAQEQFLLKLAEMTKEKLGK